MENKWLIGKNKIFFTYSLLGVICFFISPILSIFINFYLVFNSKKPKERYILAMLIALSFGYLGYHTIPIESQDLFRHYKIINILINVPLNDFLLYSYPGVYLNTCIMYLCALLGNPNLYSLILLSMGFYIILFLLMKFQEKHNLSFFNTVLIFLFVILCMNFRYYYSGLRNHFSFLLCMLVLYRSFFCKKNDWINILLFITAYFIHVGTIIIIVIYYLYLLIYSKIPSRFMKLTNCLIPLFGFASIVIVNFLANSFPTLMKITIFSKIYEYMHTVTITNLSYYALLIIFTIFMFCVTYVLKSNSNSETYRKYLNFVFFYILITIAISWNMELLVRISYMLSFISLPVHVLAIKASKSNKNFKHVYYFVMLSIIISQIAFNFVFNNNYPWIFDKHIIDLLFIV